MEHLVTVAAEAEVVRELPMPPVMFFVIVFALFLAALGVLWTFRNTAHKVPVTTHVDQHGNLQQVTRGHADEAKH